MLRIIEEPNITQNIKQKITRLEGKVLKVNIKSQTALPEVFVQIETEDNEILFSGFIENKNMNIPTIHEMIIGDSSKVDYFYSLGNIYLKVTGLKEGEKIDCIKILYEYTQIIRNSE